MRPRWRQRRVLLSLALVGLGLVLVLLSLWPRTAPPGQTAAVPLTTPTDNPVIPSPPTASPPAIATPSLSPPTATKPSATPTASAGAGAGGWLPDRQRFGVGAARRYVLPAFQAGLPFSHYLTWRMDPRPVDGFTFWQMVRLSGDGLAEGFSYAEIAGILAQNPGAIWIIGNEPDVVWQDNQTAEQYAVAYHEVHQFITTNDPTARIAIAGISQPTPLRLAYLDRILNHYQTQYGQPMPIDIWTIHAFTLHEEADSWGVGIPPGMSDELAIPYEIADHDNVTIFQENLRAFRRWMADRGYGDKPLAVTEYGILLPEDYGFPPDAVQSFMVASFDFFRTASDPASGYPPDDHRLVQWWFWFSLYERDTFTTGNLYDPQQRRLTPLGKTYAAYVNRLP